MTNVRELARLVDEPTRGVLEKALELGTVVVALTVPDRDQIIREELPINVRNLRKRLESAAV